MFSNSDSNTFGWTARIKISKPSLKNNTADADRLRIAIQRELDVDSVDIDLALCKKLPFLLRESGYRLRCLLFKDRGRGYLIHATSADDRTIIAGVAIDLGTTRVVIRLVNLESRQVLAEGSFDNPQVKIGPDVLTRIHYAGQPRGLKVVQELIVEAVNVQLAEICRKCRIGTEHIHLFTVAGNTAMGHLFSGLPVEWMVREPYIPAVNHFGLIHAARLGLWAAKGGCVFIFPNVGSYLGGDLISGILATGLHKQSENAILVDVGTNAEVILGNKDWMMACAGAAGPALEGGMSRMGATAAPGVIDQVSIDPKHRTFTIQTIDDLPPVGICGSGVIDLAAQLFLAKMIDIRGKFRPEVCGPRLNYRDGLAHLTIVTADDSGSCRELSISQAEMDSLVRSKAGMFTVLETITGTMGLTFQDLKVFYVAGTFGSFINPVSAITIGMIPDLPLDRYQSIGNTSLEGASMALVNRAVMEEINRIRDTITYLELNVNQDFMNRFSAAKFIPHTHKEWFPSVQTFSKTS